MSVNSLASQLTQLELSRREHEGKLLPMCDVTSQKIEFLLDATWHECNAGDHHKGATVSTKPTGTHRRYNKGISPESGTSDTYDEPTSMLDGLSQVDAALLTHSADKVKARMDQDSLYMSGMQETMVDDVFNGDGPVEDEITGLTNRANWATLGTGYVYDMARGNASVAANKLDMWVLGWGPDKCNMLYPRNDSLGNAYPQGAISRVEGLGLRVMPFPASLIQDSDSKKFLGFETWLECHFGLEVRDYRYVRRIANISATMVSGTYVDLDNVDDFSFDYRVLVDALNDLPTLDSISICVPRQIMGQIAKAVTEKSNSVYTMGKDTFGRPQTEIWGCPLRTCDCLNTVHATITT